MPPLDRLQAFHELLAEHYRQLREVRDQLGGGKPVFALEHGLDKSDVGELQSAVRELIRLRHPPRDAWLPMIVYAAEVGYRYSGDEYWQTFEAETPGWTDHGDRDYVRDKFFQFSQRYGGAKPTGRWANHFTIICWPITHAVLPRDLQEDLARLLYDYRHQLTADLINDPETLGARLASRAYWASARFLNFAQSPDLLGQVAAALLTGHENGSPLLLDSTLNRIVTDLGNERLARRWLAEAKARASQITLTGLTRIGTRSGTERDTRRPTRLGPLARPRLSLARDSDGGWQVQADMPDFSIVPSEFADLHLALSRMRGKVAGVAGPPLPRGALLYAPHVTITSWPEAGTPFLSLENADANLNAILADECVLSPGPPWLFRLNGPDTASEVVGKVIRPGLNYVVLADSELPTDAPDWITPVTVKCARIRAYEVRMPPAVGHREQEYIRRFGLSLGSEIEIRPVGLVPAAWDGEGRAEWIGGDPGLLAIASTRDVAECFITIDGGPATRVELKPDDSRRAFVDVSGLDVGEHDFRVSVLPTGPQAVRLDGALAVNVREPRPRTATGSYREAMLILCSPAGPTLEELWDGRVRLEVIGPTGLPVAVSVSLDMGPGVALRRFELKVPPLPVDDGAWSTAFDELRNGAAAKVYDEANACLIDVSNSDLGTVSMRCGREFSALRWGVGRDRDGPYGLLYDNIGAKGLLVERFQFATPDVNVRVAVDPNSRLRDEAGGLFLATWNEVQSGVIMPPAVRSLADLQKTNVKPRIVSGSRSPDTIDRWTRLSWFWASARLSGDVLGRLGRDRVLRAFAGSICSVIGGPRWAACERAIAEQDDPVKAKAAWGLATQALGDTQYHMLVVADIKREAKAFPGLTIDDRIEHFARVLKRIAPNLPSGLDHGWMATFLLRLTSSPGLTMPWAGHLGRAAIETAISHPIMLRAARFLVLGVHLDSDGGLGQAPFSGWSWE